MNNPFYNDEQSPHFRLIPQLEKMPALVRFAQTYGGKLCIALAYWLIFCTIHPHSSWLNGWAEKLLKAAVIAILVFPEKRKGLRLFVALAALAVLTERPVFNFSAISGTQGALFHSVTQPLRAAVSSFGLLFRLLVFISGMFFSWVYCRYVYLKRPRHPLLLLGTGIAVLVGLAMLFPAHGLFYVTAWAIVLNLCKNAPGAGYAVLSQPRDREPEVVPSLMLSLQSQLLPLRRPILRSVELFNQPLSTAASAVCRLKAVKLFFYCRLILWFRDIVRYFFFGDPEGVPQIFLKLTPLNWANYRSLGFAQYNALHMPALRSFELVLINCFFFICTFCYACDSIVSSVRLCGIYLPRYVCRPYLAKTFNEFFRRLLFYYSELIVHFFYYPAWGALRSLRDRRKLRSQLALFYAVCIGGWILHIQSAANELVLVGSRDALAYYLSWWPYFFLMGAVCCISASHILDNRVFSKAPGFVRIGLIFSTYAILLVMISLNSLETWQDRLVFFRSMIGR
jgi:hypothetical protein